MTPCIERLPSRKCAINSQLLHLGMLSYGLLRLTGQSGIKAPVQRLGNKAARRPLRTAIESMTTLAARRVSYARRWKPAFVKHRLSYLVFRHVFAAFSNGGQVAPRRPTCGKGAAQDGRTGYVRPRTQPSVLQERNSRHQPTPNSKGQQAAAGTS